MKPMEARRAELYAYIADKAAEVSCSLGLDSGMAEHIGAAITDSLAEDFGGEVLSFPKDAAYKLSKREIEILGYHRKGATFAELARRYNMGERGIRKLVKRAELRNPGIDQPGLFQD